MIVILEGPDGSGKSTLARYLAHRFDLAYHHEGPPPVGVTVVEHYLQLLENSRDVGVVFDRLALGERVYGPILRAVDRLGVEGWARFNVLASELKARQVMCLPDPDTCYWNWRTRKGELFSEESMFFHSYAKFAHFAQVYGIQVWDYERTTPEELIRTWEEKS